MYSTVSRHERDEHCSSLGKDKHGLAKLNPVAFFQGEGLVLGDRLPVDFRAVGAALVLQSVIAVAHTDDGGVQARDGQVFQEDIAFAAAPDAEGLFLDVIDAPRLFDFFNAHKAATE